jgi:hypothetical protein
VIFGFLGPNGLDGVTGVSIYGYTFRVPNQTVGGLVRQLETATGAGVLIRSVLSVPPTLKDVFLVPTRSAPEGPPGLRA